MNDKRTEQSHHKENALKKESSQIIPDEIVHSLTTRFIGKEIDHRQTTPSTNRLAKEEALINVVDGKLYLADEQTEGKGRLGRYWSSPKGKSVAISLSLVPKLAPSKISLLTQLAAAALVTVLPSSLKPKIKWPNDIVVDGKKVSGILTEAHFDQTHLHYVIIGIQINTNLIKDELPSNIKQKATSLRMLLDESVDPNPLIADFLNQFEQFYLDFIATGDPSPFLAVCRTYSAVIGKDVTVLLPKNNYRKARVIDIDSEGQLVVRYEDSSQHTTLFSGEISIRGLNGYI